MLFDRDKLQLTLDTEKESYLPGETVRGRFRVRVLKEVEVTALRVRLYAKEKVSVKRHKDKATREERQRGDRKQPKRGSVECLHFDKLITLFGYSQESGRKAGAQLAPGRGTFTANAGPGEVAEAQNWNESGGQGETLSTSDGPDGDELVYPFEIPLPTSTAPSYSFQLDKKGQATLTYKLQGIAVIPNGFDGRVERYLTVLPAVPLQQAEAMATARHVVPLGTLGIRAKGGCCGEKDLNPTADVEFQCPQLIIFDETGYLASGRAPHSYREEQQNAAMATVAEQERQQQETQLPPIIQASQNGNGRYTNNGTAIEAQSSDEVIGGVVVEKGPRRPRPHVYLPVSVRIVNNSSRTPIKAIKVTLKQYLQIRCEGVSRAEIHTITSHTHCPPGGGLAPRQAFVGDINLDIGGYLSMDGTMGGSGGGRARRSSFELGGRIMPTIATQFIEISNIVEVSFPGGKSSQVLEGRDACWLVAAVDPSNRTAAVPTRYNRNVLMPEEVWGGAM